MRRFFIDKKAIKGKSVVISGEEAHHITDVIRLKAGDRFIGFDGTGKTYMLRINTISPDVEAEIEKVSDKKIDLPKIMLACAIPKSRKIEDIIEKATELGVSDIVPMITERTIARIEAKSNTAKKKRWERIVLSAAKQCGRSSLPELHDITDFKGAIELAGKLGYNKKIIPCLSEGARQLKETLYEGMQEAAIFIGPEGDFTEKEVECAIDAGLEPVSLGQLVLRVDTACIFTISAISALYA